MSNFKGFSEDEIKKLTTTSSVKIAVKSIDDDILNGKRVLLKVKKGQKNAVIKNLTSSKTLQKNEDEDSKIPDGARLSPFNQTKKSPSLVCKNEINNQETESSVLENRNYPNENYDDKNTVVPEIPLQSDGEFHPAKRKQLPDTDVKDPPPRVISSQDEPRNDKNGSLITSSEGRRRSSNSSSSSNSLQTLQARQKLIEEQNRKRKEILAKALADKTKKTREETERLNEIQREFKKLDALLSEDVNILRRQIEIASFDFMEAHYSIFSYLMGLIYL
ncbi:uncharacterized protein LOC108742498 isoform X2 [Agrilus planipennis]|uniref:RAB6-interacting golgin n=1 Tax=Agrilus planipennis TaxID=224129 RepID=A0A7F5RIE3_AGRPL|nr:uncharacterized protein LOC108742498 isoform X2 [Agrilus planipennis]